jgi:hypothetical protein
MTLKFKLKIMGTINILIRWVRIESKLIINLIQQKLFEFYCLQIQSLKN